MKATVERPVMYFREDSFNEAVKEFIELIYIITRSENEKELKRKIMKSPYLHWTIGFGGHHMWVH